MILNYKKVCKGCILDGNCTERCEKFRDKISKAIDILEGTEYSTIVTYMFEVPGLCPICKCPEGLIGTWEVKHPYQIVCCFCNTTFVLSQGDLKFILDNKYIELITKTDLNTTMSFIDFKRRYDEHREKAFKAARELGRSLAKKKRKPLRRKKQFSRKKR